MPVRSAFSRFLPAGRLAALIALLLAALTFFPADTMAQSPPPKPESVSVTRADGTLTASWNDVRDATDYHITYTSNSGGSWSLAAFDHAETSITIGVDNSKTYIVGVRAKNNGVGGGWKNSPPAGPYTPPAPATPDSVTVTRADGTLTASWDAVSGATDYHVTYTSNNGGSWSLAAFSHAETSISIDAYNYKTYIVGVRAKNGNVGSGWRNSPPSGPYIPPTPTPEPTPEPTKPAAPTGLTAAAGDESVTLSWDDPADSSITGYEYRMNHNDTSTGNFSGWGSWQAIAGGGTAMLDYVADGLTNGRVYRFKLRAVNAVGASASAPRTNPWFVSATPQAPAPTLVAEDVTATGATLSIGNWNQSWYYQSETAGGASGSSGGAGAAAASNQSNCNGPVNGSQTTITGLTPDSRYAYGAYSNNQCSQALAAGAQGAAFSTAQAQAQASSVRLTGHSIESNSLTLNISGHTAAWHYKATSYLNKETLAAGICTSVAANTSSVEVSSLTAGTDYGIKAYSDSACADANELTDDVTDLDFSTHGVVLNASYLLVPENGTYPHTVRLATEPLASVTVAITTSGDADITADTDTTTAGNQNTLTFTTTNWNTPQTVTLAAADDNDTVPGTGKGDGGWAYGDTTLTYTATSDDANYNGLFNALNAEEADDDVCQGTTAVGGSTVTTGDLVDECNLLLPGKDLVNGSGNKVDNWDTGTAMNSWTGVTVTWTGTVGRVTDLVFPIYSYIAQTGNLPNTIGGLTELTDVEYQSTNDPDFIMPVPNGIGNLTKLTELKIYRHRLVGEFPSSVVNLTLLEQLQIDGNYLSGPLPSTLDNLTRLTRTFLGSEGLSGPIPDSLGNLTLLEQLGISNVNGNITGHIPASLGNLTNLKDGSIGLGINGNRLTGCIPASLSSRAGTDEINPQRDAAGNDVTLEVCTAGIGVSDSSVAVGEGGDTDVGIRLLTAPTANVTVAVTSSSGDSNLTADTDTSTTGNQTSLAFTTTNWGTPQTVRISAAADGDSAAGSKTFTFTSSSTDTNYSSKTAAVAATENDDEATVSASGATSTSATLSLTGYTSWHYRQDYPQGDSSCNAVSSASTTVHGLQTDTTHRFGAYLDSDCSDESFIDDATFATPLADLATAPCLRNGVTTLWVGYACYIRAGDGGILPFHTIAREGDSATLVHLLERGGSGIGATEALAYNPNGGTATVKTALNNGSPRDTFTINVVRFGIREVSVSKPSAGTNDSFTLTVKLNSPSHIRAGKYRENSKNTTTDLARSWVQLTLPSNSGMTGNDHERSGGVSDPIQVVDQDGDSVAFTINTGATQTGTFDIAIKAYRPAPDVGCPLTGDPTQGDPPRCYLPPVGSETLSYTVE